MTIIEEKALAAQRQKHQEQGHESGPPATIDDDANTVPLVTDGFEVPEIDAAEDAPPAYGDRLDELHFSQPDFDAGAVVTSDGRVNININTKNRGLANLLAPALASQISVESEEPLPPAYIPPSLGGHPDQIPPPPLNIVIQIVGSRGDVQPFVALGKTLKDTYGHRVRIATHTTFQPFVKENGLEFFNIGGDPAELMAFMVKHPGLMPGFDAVTSGEVSKRRKGIEQILLGCWRSCIETGNGLGPPPKPHKTNEPLDLAGDLSINGGQKPFVADAIIANPPSFAHVHVAEKLGIPLHMMFTMPWSPTRAFPHPLANVQSTNTDDVMTNTLTYTLVEMMTWQGLGDIINRFREKVLDLPGLSLIWAPGLLNRLKIPYTYCWSPALIPKPQDWRKHIDVAGFFFLNLASSYTPDPDLAAYLDAGPPPVYIGFGSIVVDDPNAMTRTIFDAVHQAGVRALVSKGWGGLGAEDVGLPDGVFMLGNVPHDWLFEHVSCVVHHGGAGTSAAGIKAGKPTVVVPFFGDQPFWGAMIAKAKAGPEPIPYKELTVEKLAEAIKHCLLPDTVEQAAVLGEKIRQEMGCDTGGQSFHSQLKMDSLRCSIAPSRTAAWRVRRTQLRLSPFAATVLVNRGLLTYSDLKLYRSLEHNTEDQPPDPISAATSALVMTISGMGMAIADIPKNIWKTQKRENSTTSANVDSSTTSQAPVPRETSSLTSQHTADSKESLPAVATSSQQSVVTDAATASNKDQPPGKSEKRDNVTTFNFDAAVGASKEVERFVTTGVKSPMNFYLGLAKGFRNMPRLYNDDTVRPVEKVTDFGSGVKLAGKEFGLGLYDGIAGLVMQPLRGAEKEGAAGLFKGFGKGIGGLITKPAAGAFSVPAYTMQGVHMEIHKFFSRSVQNYIITSRVQQGQIDVKDSTSEEQDDIVNRWNNAKSDLKGFNQLKRKGKEKSPLEPSSKDKKGSSASRPQPDWSEPRKAEEKTWKRDYKKSEGSFLSAASPSAANSESDEVERAIQASVRETSHGNAEEDAAIEAAIRESISAMRDRGAHVPGTKEQLDEKNSALYENPDYEISDEEYQQLIEQAIIQSLENQGQSQQLEKHEKSDVKTNTREESRRQPPTTPSRGTEIGDDDKELQRAIAASEEESSRIAQERSEEDIVLEYIKKQSLAEEEYRKRQHEGKGIRKTDASGHDSEDEEMKRALEESLKSSGGDGAAGPSGSAI